MPSKLGNKQEMFSSSVEENIQNILNSSVFVDGDEGGLKKAAERLCIASNAKRIRSDIVYCFGSALNISEKKMIQIAVAAELIHAASLLHDDVIDYGDMRRGKPSANFLYGNTVAVLTGDLLYTQALESLTSLPMTVFEEAIQVVKYMTMAASIEYNYRENLDITTKEWLIIADGKTSKLFSWCAKMPAILDQNKKLADVFSESGHLIGNAFQLADDLKDFFAVDDIGGKGLYSDLKNKNPNYVLSVAMSQSDELKAEISHLWEQDKWENSLNEIGLKIFRSEAFKLSLKQLNEWLNKSIRILEENGEANLANNLKYIIKKMYHSLSPSILKEVQKFMTLHGD